MGLDVLTRGKFRQYFAASVANLMMVSYGLAAGWPAPALPLLMSADSPLSMGPISREHAAWLASIICLAGLPFTPFIAYICERWGRKACGHLTAALHVAGFVLLAVADSLALLYVSRVLVAAGATGNFIFTPMYVRELSDDVNRGPLGILMTIIINVGVLGAYIVGAYFPYRVAAGLLAAPAIAFVFLLFWMPESPVFLLRCGRDADAERALAWLRGTDGDARSELHRLKDSLNAMNSGGGHSAWAAVKEMFTEPAALRATLIYAVLTLNLHFSGLFCIVSYTVSILQEAGTSISPYLSSIIVGLMLTLGTIVSVFFINRLGRKILLVSSDICMAIALFTMGLYFYLKHTGTSVSAFGWVPVTSLSVYVIAFNIGMGPITLLLATEIFSPKLVGTALMLAGPFGSLLSFLIGMYYHKVSEIIGLHTCYWFFSMVCVAGMAFVIAFVPETRCRPVESIIQELKGSPKKKQVDSKREYEPVQTKAV